MVFFSSVSVSVVLFWFVVAVVVFSMCWASTTMSFSMRSLVLRNSSTDVTVVTGVSPAISMRVVLLSMGTSIIFMIEGYDRNAPWVLMVSVYFSLLDSSTVQSNLAIASGMPSQSCCAG